jgi:hypothetical protein
MNNLEETGILDDATKKLMQTPRCGFPDIIFDNEGKLRKNNVFMARFKIGSYFIFNVIYY